MLFPPWWWLLLGLAPLAQPRAELPGLDELMEIEVTTAARKPQPVADSAAAVFVITAEDIRRSGATNVPEALRLAPGVEVAKINANRWAVSIRGSNSRFANKLQVLVDGRTLYTPLFAGVFWEDQDLMLEEIDHIEVIRGPGAAVWGANAVNGVINIITRHAGDSQGTLASASAGTEERGRVSLRQGVQLGPDSFLKAYLQATARDESAGTTAPPNDASDGGRAGVRWDLRQGDDRFLVTADLNRNLNRETEYLPLLAPPWQAIAENTGYQQGAYLLGRWERTGRDGAVTSIQGIAEISDLDTTQFDELRRSFELEYQRHEAPLGGHDLVWGLAVRRSSDQFADTRLIEVIPEELTLNLFSLYLQDEITLVPERWRLTLGARLEHNDYTGYEFQPSVKLLFQPDEGQSLWTSVSRAIRTPSRGERSFVLPVQTIPPFTASNPSPLPVLVTASGNPDLDAEELLAFELGWRGRLGEALSAEAVAYLHRYDGIFSFTQPGRPQQVGDHWVSAIGSGNSPERDWARGVELAADWRPADAWRVRLAGSLMDGFQGDTPYQLSLRLSHDLTEQVELDLWFKRNGPYETPGPVPAWTGLDLRIAWHPQRNLELALIGQNLLDDRHLEFYPSYVSSPLLEVERNLMVKATWRF